MAHAMARPIPREGVSHLVQRHRRAEEDVAPMTGARQSRLEIMRLTGVAGCGLDNDALSRYEFALCLGRLHHSLRDAVFD